MPHSSSLRVNLIVILVALQVVTVALILLFSRISNEQVMIAQASQILDNAAKESLVHTKGFLRPAIRMALSTADLLSEDVFQGDELALQSYFLTQLQSHHEFVGIYVANPKGEFHYVSRNNEKKDSAYRVKKISMQLDAKRTVVTWLSSDLKEVVPPTAIQDTYNPLVRPWYQAALEKEQLIWTDPYLFFTSKKAGITLAVPYYRDGQVHGVIGVDIELTDLSEFLATLNIGESGSALIMDKQERYIAISGDRLDNLASKNDLELQFKAQDEQLLANAVASIYSKQHRRDGVVSGIKFDFDDTSYLASFYPFRLHQQEKQWVLATYAKEHTFLQKIRYTEKTNLLIAFFILLLSICVGWILATKTWKPIENLQDQAITDQLTGVYNRHYLFTQGKRLFERAMHQGNEILSLAIIDIDDFKYVNDTFGHNVGDEVLASLAMRIESELRPEDVVVRLGGEEFIVLLPSTPIEISTGVIRRLQKNLEKEPIQTSRGSIPITLSIGIGTSDQLMNGTSFIGFIERVDKALYKAKHLGKNQVSNAA